MATPKVNPVPSGMHTVTPHLICAGAANAIAFYTKAFGAVETARIAGKDGKLMHAAIRIGDSTVMLVDEMPDWGSLGPKSLKGTTVTIHLYVDDADGFAARAVAAGAKMTMPVAEMSGAIAMANWKTRSAIAGRSPRMSRMSAPKTCKRRC